MAQLAHGVCDGCLSGSGRPIDPKDEWVMRYRVSGTGIVIDPLEQLAQ
jgi:hypothetical protein